MTSFDINGKVALVTGGASGIGLQYVIQLLENGAKGITIADLVSEVGEKVLKEIEEKFGKNKAIFVKTDVTDYDQFQNAFEKTVNTFKNVDILINNAGILNDDIWQKEIAINVNGTIHGMLLGLDNYIPKYKSGPEGLIVNLSSIAGLAPFDYIPIYTATKFAVHGMTWSWGQQSHFNRTKVRVVGICPGVTNTPLITESDNKNLGTEYEKLRRADIPLLITQTSQQLAALVIKVIQKAPPGTMWVIEGGQEPYQYLMPDRMKIPKVHL